MIFEGVARFLRNSRSNKKDPSIRSAGLFLFNDVRITVGESGISITHEQALDLAFYTIYALADHPEDVTPKSVPGDLTSIFPAQCKPIDGDVQALANRIANSGITLTRQQAVIEYLTIVHQIPYFGCEMIKTKFQVADDEKSDSKARQEATVVVGPKNVTILLPSNEPYTVIPWFRIIGIKEHKGSVDIRYMERKGAESCLSLKVKKPNELATLLSGYNLRAQLQLDIL